MDSCYPCATRSEAFRDLLETGSGAVSPDETIQGVLQASVPVQPLAAAVIGFSGGLAPARGRAPGQA